MVRMRTMGQASAVVYRLRSEYAFKASAGVSLYGPSGSVKIAEQLLMAAISPVSGISSSSLQILSQPCVYRVELDSPSLSDSRPHKPSFLLDRHLYLYD